MKNEEIKVSVIILAYNQEKYLRHAIESVLNQKTDFNYEILINDDCSRDKTPYIAQEYAEKYPDKIKFTRQEKNIGATRSGYEMLIKCRGQYIAGCEGDDYWCDENKLQIQADFLDSHSEYSGCAHEMRIVSENDVPLKNQKISWISKHRDYGIEDFKGIRLPGHPNSIMRRNYCLHTNFECSILYKANNMVGDRTIALIWASKGRFYRFPQVMGCYRFVREKDAENITSKLYIGSDDNIQNDFEYTLRLEEYAKSIHSKASFEYHKHELYCSAKIQSIFKGKNKELPYVILNSCKNRLICLLSFPAHIISKACIKLTGKKT